MMSYMGLALVLLFPIMEAPVELAADAATGGQQLSVKPVEPFAGSGCEYPKCADRQSLSHISTASLINNSDGSTAQIGSAVTVIESTISSGLLFYIAEEGAASGYYYGTRHNGDLDVTHLTVVRDETFVASLFFDERGAPVHWMLPDHTFALMTFGNPRQRMIMACDEGLNSLTFNLEALLDQAIIDVLFNLKNFLGAASVVAEELAPQYSDFIADLQTLRESISDLGWTNKTVQQALNIAQTPSEKAQARLLASVSVGLDIMNKMNFLAPPIVDVLSQMMGYLAKIEDGHFERADIEGPRVSVLLCAGQSLLPNKCNNFYLFNKPGNLSKCVNVCRVSLRCFTGICHPTYLSVAEVLQFRGRQ